MSDLPKGWAKTTMDKLVELAQGVAINAKTNHVLCEELEGLPLLKINNLLNNTIDQYANPKLVPQKSILKRDDIIFTRTGQVGWVFTNKIGILHNNSFKVIPSEKLNKKFLYWFLKQKSIYSYVQKVAAGSAQPDLNHGAFKTISIKYPTNLDEQKEIANILSSFDKKIELLKEQNQTLETMAQTIFKEWFVDFNYPNATGEMIDSEMGEIPKGWKISDLRNLSEVISKGTTPIKSENEKLLENIYFLKVKDITDNGNIKYDSLEKISSEIHTTVLKRSQLKTDDLLYSIAGTIGRVAILPKQLDNSNCNQALAFIRLKEKNKYLEYIHQWIQSSKIKNKINSSIVQGVQANVSLTVLGNVLIIIPDDKTVENWMNVIKPIYKKIKNNSEQIQTLEKTRDSLLPKLMSGKIRLKDFDESN